MSQAHHLDSVVYNEVHATQHIKVAEEHARKLNAASKRKPEVKRVLAQVAADRKKVMRKKGL
jgi:hypothetical protein